VTPFLFVIAKKNRHKAGLLVSVIDFSVASLLIATIHGYVVVCFFTTQ